MTTERTNDLGAGCVAALEAARVLVSRARHAAYSTGRKDHEVAEHDFALARIDESIRALRQAGEPVAVTTDNGPGKVVGLQWNPSYPVHALAPGTPLYALTPKAVP